MPDDSLHDLAGAIADGSSVDWSAAESDGGAPVRDVIRELKVIAGIAAVHASAPLPSDGAQSPPHSAGADETSARIWGPLRLLEKIGEGAYGEVFRAWDTRLDREVALKLLAAGRASARTTSSIVHEGRLLARVRHPNVVTIYGAETIDDRVGLWMELVRGRTLEQILKEGTLFSAAEATRIGIDICGAVSAVHGAGLLHRDIKAHNVMLADDGRVVLMDFGTGQEIQAGSSIALAGTPVYLAPEVLFGHPATVQSDIYSIGVLLFHLLSGSYPVQGRSTTDVRRAHEENARVSLKTARPDLPASLVSVIDRALDPHTERRHQRAEALTNDLVALNTPQRGHIRWYVKAAAVAVLAALAFGIVVRQRDTELPSTNAPAVTVPVIAVLPFENLSTGADSEEFADGLTYEVHRNLAVIEGLELRSAAASFAFRGKARNLADIGEQLGADHVLEGSVMRAVQTTSVTVRLARVSDGTTVWGDKFDRDNSAVFEIKDQISLAIVNALRLKLGRAQRRYDMDSEVYSQFLRANVLRSRRHPENAARAATIFEAIVAKNPSLAPAWAGLASAVADATRHQPREEMPPLDPRMEPAAREAIRLDPLLAEAHAAMGNVCARNRDWTNARKAFEIALELNPSLTTTYTDFVLSTLMPMGRTAESLQYLEDARRVDPLSLDVRRLMTHLQVNVGRHAEAVESGRWVVERDPDFPYIGIFLGRALLFAGRPAEALALFENSDSEGDWGYIGYLYAVTGRRDEAEALAAKHPESAARQMLIYGGLGDKDRAFKALERTAAINWWRAATWMVRPEMAILRNDPRVADLRRKLKLPPFEE